LMTVLLTGSYWRSSSKFLPTK
ncbi:hypothetical protein CCACVL1_23744, partial [Corchorus capsularis]